MFDAIAGRYDLLNHLLSAGIDRRWRRRAIRVACADGSRARARPLHRHGGSGDCGATAAPAAARCGRRRFRRARCCGWARTKIRARGSTTRLRSSAATRRASRRDASVDAVTIAFGIRNVERHRRRRARDHRVLRPGGRLAILEFAIPDDARRAGGSTSAYFSHVLPRIGRLVSRHNAAYGYLPASVGAFASPDEFVKILRQVGFATFGRPADLRHRLSRIRLEQGEPAARLVAA